jgi:hypothetical protein
MARQFHVGGGDRFRVKSGFFDQLPCVPRQPLHIHAPLLDEQELLHRLVDTAAEESVLPICKNLAILK